MRLMLALSLTLAIACTKSQPEPAKPAAPPAPALTAAAVPGNSELENKGVAMMQRLADTFAADAADCDKLAVDIKAFVVQNRELLGQLTELENSQSDQEKQAFEQRNKATQDSIVAKMEPAMNKCHDNPQVQAALKEFPGSE